jgi:hypothetical protein
VIFGEMHQLSCKEFGGMEIKVYFCNHLEGKKAGIDEQD